MSKSIFMPLNFFMQMFNMSTLCMQSTCIRCNVHCIRWLQEKLRYMYKLIFPCMHYQSTNKALIKKQRVKKMAKFKTLSSCQKVFLWHRTSSCTCLMYLHCVCKVSDGFWTPTKILRSNVSKHGLVQSAVISSTRIFMASNFFMQTSSVSILCMQSIRKIQKMPW